MNDREGELYHYKTYCVLGKGSTGINKIHSTHDQLFKACRQF